MYYRNSLMAAMMGAALSVADASGQTATLVPENHECVQGEVYQITLETAEETNEVFHAQSLPAWKPRPANRYRGPRIDWNELRDENYLTVADRCGGFEFEVYIERAERGWRVEGGDAPGRTILQNGNPRVLVQGLVRMIGEKAVRHKQHNQSLTKSESVRTLERGGLWRDKERISMRRNAGNWVDCLNGDHTREWMIGRESTLKVTMVLDRTMKGWLERQTIKPKGGVSGEEEDSVKEDFVRDWRRSIRRCSAFGGFAEGRWEFRLEGHVVKGVERTRWPPERNDDEDDAKRNED